MIIVRKERKEPRETHFESKNDRASCEHEKGITMLLRGAQEEGATRWAWDVLAALGMWSEMRVGYPGEMSRSQLDYKTGAEHGDMDLGVSCRDELT